jgi:hypothetical protein
VVDSLREYTAGVFDQIDSLRQSLGLAAKLAVLGKSRAPPLGHAPDGRKTFNPRRLPSFWLFFAITKATIYLIWLLATIAGHEKKEALAAERS